MSLADMVRRVQLFLLYPHVDVTNLGDMLNAAALQAHTAANPPNPYQTVKRYLAALEPPSPGDAPVFSSPGTSTSSKHSRIMQMKGKNGSLPSDPVKHVKESRNVEQPASPLLVSRVQKQTAALSASPEGKSNIKKTAKDEHSRKRKHQSIGQDEAKGVQCLSSEDPTRNPTQKSGKDSETERPLSTSRSRKRKKQSDKDSEGDRDHAQRLEARKLRRRERAAIKQPEKGAVEEEEKPKKKRKPSAAEQVVARATGGPSRKTLNVSKDRITIKDQPKLGLFSKGASSAQMTKQSIGVPDLAFREYSFLSRKPSNRAAVFAPVAESDLKSKYRRQESDEDDAHSAASLAQRRRQEVKEHAPRAIASKPVMRKRQKSAEVSSDASSRFEQEKRRSVSPDANIQVDEVRLRRGVPLAPRSADVSLNVPNALDVAAARYRSASLVQVKHLSPQPHNAPPLRESFEMTAEPDHQTALPESCRPQSAPTAARPVVSRPPSYIQSARPHSADHQRISSNESIPLDQINMTGWSRLHSSDEIPMDWLYAPESNEGEVLFNQPVHYAEEWLTEVESPLPDECYMDHDEQMEEEQYDEHEQYPRWREGQEEEMFANDQQYTMHEEAGYQEMDILATQEDEEEQDEMQRFWWKPRRRE